MLTVRYREEGQSEFQTFVASRLTYVGTYAEFALHDVDDDVQLIIKPVRLEVKAVVNVDDN